MVEIKSLSFGYQKKGNLFNGLNLELTGGSIYGLLGKNGAGKTTLLKIIAGLLTPNAGDCMVEGVSSRERNPLALSELYMVPEEFYTPSVSAEELGNLYGPFYPRFDKTAYSSCLKEFGLNERDQMTAMSYGQKKKTLISFGLASNTRLLILDEPTNGLDIPSKAVFRRLLAGMAADERAFIISTHQVRDMENLIDPIVILDNGKIVFHQSSADISEKLQVRFIQDEKGKENALHFEPVPGGFSLLEENRDGNESKVDIEMLFNAVLSDSDRVQSIFNRR